MTNSQDCDKAQPFWRRKPLEALTVSEWESLCDGCGRCCLVKLEDEDTGEVHFTGVACRLYDSGACKCRNYPDRSVEVPDCVTLTAETVRELTWLPPSCAYRLVAEGKDLYWWHPLVSGSPDTVHEAGVSTRGKVAAHEGQIALRRLPQFIVGWPKQLPPAARRRSPPAKKT